MRGRWIVLAAMLVAEVASASSAPRTRKRVDRPVAMVVPSDVLRRVAQGADTLELIPWDGRDGSRAPLLRVVDAKAIAALLAVIETTPVDARTFTMHGCAGYPLIRLYRRGRLLTEFSFDHVSMLRPIAPNLWSTGDADMMPASARAIATWFAEHGYREYLDEIEARAREEAQWEAFYSVYPNEQQSILRAAINVSGLRPGQSKDGASVGAPLEAALPDERERVRLACRALGLLDGSWLAQTRPEAMVIDSVARVSASSFVETIASVEPESPESLGAARLLFGAPVGDGPRWMERLDKASVIRLAVQLVPSIVAKDGSWNADQLPNILSWLRSPAVEELLRAQTTKVAEAWDRTCGMIEPALPLGALVVLAGWRIAPPEALSAAGARSWQCAANRSAALIAQDLAEGRLPAAAVVRDSDSTAAFAVLARLRELQSPQAIALAFDALLDHHWGVVREATEEWLRGVTGEADVRAAHERIRRKLDEEIEAEMQKEQQEEGEVDGH